MPFRLGKMPQTSFVNTSKLIPIRAGKLFSLFCQKESVNGEIRNKKHVPKQKSSVCV